MGRPGAPNGVLLFVQDINEGIALEKDGLKITAFEVDHSPVWPAFGHRIDYGGRSVVLSGDTRMMQNLIHQAVGVDLLVDEPLQFPPEWRRYRDHKVPSQSHHRLPSSQLRALTTASESCRSQTLRTQFGVARSRPGCLALAAEPRMLGRDAPTREPKGRAPTERRTP